MIRAAVEAGVQAGIILLLLTLPARAAEGEPANDYPTNARAEYVFGCMAATGQWLEHRHEHHAFMRKITRNFPQVDSDGYCALPDAHGVGAEVDEEFLKSNPAADWTPEVFREDGSPGDW